MEIRTANKNDFETLCSVDRHIAPKELAQAVSLGRVLAAEEKGSLAGWLRWNLFWDNTPFMNLLFVQEQHRGTGMGKALVQAWEAEMAGMGYKILMTSTASNEYAQHFYERLGYRVVGGFTMPGEPYELIFVKEITNIE